MIAPNVVTLYEHNHRDPVATLRHIADQIEAGKYGEVGELVVALMGDTFEVFGAGPVMDGASAAVMLQAGALRLVREVEQHGR